MRLEPVARKEKTIFGENPHGAAVFFAFAF